MSDSALVSDLAVISSSRLFFGHQSVGRNILGGIRHLMQTSGSTSPNIISLDSTSILPTSFFAEANVGENTNPES